MRQRLNAPGLKPNLKYKREIMHTNPVSTRTCRDGNRSRTRKKLFSKALRGINLNAAWPPDLHHDSESVIKALDIVPKTRVQILKSKV